MSCSSTALCWPGCTAALLSWCSFQINMFLFSLLKLLLYERNWLNRWKTSVLHEGEGSITNIQWRANLIAWSNNVVSDQSETPIREYGIKRDCAKVVSLSQGVKIYDIGTKQRITNVLRDNVSLRPDMYPCSLCWKDNATLIVGWGKSIKVCCSTI